MKYILLAYTAQKWSEVDYGSPEFLAMTRFYTGLGAELTASGELLATEGLADPKLTRTLRRGPAGPVREDGPYAPEAEVLTSFSVIEVLDEARALEIAARIVDAVGDTVEVRPIGADPTPEAAPVDGGAPQA